MSLYKNLFWIAVIIWIALIFNLSAQATEQSNELSKGVTKIIVKTIEQVAPHKELSVRNFNYIVRKNAHFIAYLVLGLLVVNALKKGGIYGWQGVVLALMICVLFALSDEVHQLFVQGRNGQIKDVMIDSMGACTGLVMDGLLSKLFGKKRTKIGR